MSPYWSVTVAVKAVVVAGDAAAVGTAMVVWPPAMVTVVITAAARDTVTLTVFASPVTLELAGVAVNS